MHKKTAVLLTLLCMAGGFSGCQKKAPPSAYDPTEAVSAETQMSAEIQYSGNLCYLEGHGTADAGEMTQFVSQLESDGYTWTVSSFSEIPEETDVLILCAPREDITSDELKMLDAYLDEGGRILLFMEADESNTRYKYLERLLEEFCIEMDYDKVTETDDFRMYDDDPAWIQADMISYPSTMRLYSDAAANGIPYFRNARSFRITCFDNFNALRLDTMLVTAVSAVGTPFGGVEEDPITFENEKLGLMVYSYDDTRNVSAMVAVGSYDFLTDAYYGTESALSSTAWVHSVLSWLTM